MQKRMFDRWAKDSLGVDVDPGYFAGLPDELLSLELSFDKTQWEAVCADPAAFFEQLRGVVDNDLQTALLEYGEVEEDEEDEDEEG